MLKRLRFVVSALIFALSAAYMIALVMTSLFATHAPWWTLAGALIWLVGVSVACLGLAATNAMMDSLLNR